MCARTTIKAKMAPSNCARAEPLGLRDHRKGERQKPKHRYSY